MSITTDEQPGRQPRGWVRRVGVLSALVGLLGTGLVAATATAAFAVWCGNPPTPGTHESISHDSAEDKDYLLEFDALAVAPVFDIAASSVIGNDGGAAITRTASVTDTHTYTVQTTNKASASVKLDFFKKVSFSAGYEFTQQETDTKTTTVATSDAIMLQPHTAWRADRGVEAVNITYNLRTYLFSANVCYYQPNLSVYNAVDNVPTTVERWDWKFYPTINPGGVIRADATTPPTYYDIHPGTIVALYGNGFEPANTVIISQGGRTWTIGAGSPYWYESYGQINALLPSDLSPNAYAQVSVRARTNQPSSLETLWPRSIYINP